jgi:LPXTG-motif cell wall-anchored protein
MKNRFMAIIKSLILISIPILFLSPITLFSLPFQNEDNSVKASGDFLFLSPAGASARFRDNEPFTIVLLPDSQIYSQNYPHVYTNQTEWIINNSARENIEYVLHEGDITNRNTIVQWDNANWSQRILDGHVKYTLSPGNHDLGPNGNAANRDTYMNDYFDLSEYSAWPTYGGAFEEGKIENTYHLFSAGGLEWMIVSLEFAPRDAVLAWANQVVSDYPERLVLIVTHNYLAGNVRNPGYGGNYGLTNDAAGAASGEDMWQNFVKKHRNIICVFCGHILTEAGYLASTGIFGNTVHQMLANFQMLPNGGNGYFRLVEFDTELGNINVETYSPYLNQYKNNSQHKFQLDFKKWHYIDDPPMIKNDVQQFELNEDEGEKYIQLDGNDKPDSGIFADINVPDGDSLTYYIWNGKKWSDYDDEGIFENDNLTASIEDNKTLRILTKMNQNGVDLIRLKAEDSVGESIATNLTITVKPVNDPPIINETMNWIYSEPKPILVQNTLICFEDQWSNFTITAYDPLEPKDSNSFEFSWNGSESNAAFFNLNEESGAVSFLPNNSHVGIYFIKISLKDGGEINNIDEFNFKLQINNTNDPPKIITNNIIECYEDQLYEVEYLASDIDPTDDDFIWELDTNADFLTLGRRSGIISGVPDNNDVGIYSVNITVNDNHNGYDFTNFELTVINTNDQPNIIDTFDEFSFNEDLVDNHINLKDWFMDIDGDSLIFRAISDMNVTVEILDTGEVVITPKPNWSGKGAITFYANDSKTEISDFVTYSVRPLNDPPTNPSIILPMTNYYENRYQQAIGNASDVDIPYGDTLYYIWSSNVSGELNWGSEINLSLPAGLHTLTLTVRDKEGSTNRTSVEILIHKLPTSDLDPNTGGGKEQKTSEDDNSVLIMAGVVVVLIIVLLLLFFMLMRKKKDEVSDKPESLDDSITNLGSDLKPKVT